MSSLRDTPMFFAVDSRYEQTLSLPYPNSYTEAYTTIETVNQSEAGTDLVNVTRQKKASISMAFTCLPGIAEQILSWQNRDSFLFVRNTPIDNGAIDDGKVSVVRMRNVNVQLVKGSEDLQAVRGVWNISFTLEEF